MPADPFLEGLLKEQPSLHRYALSLTHHMADADDLSQETLCRAIARRDRFQLGTNLGAWLHVIARHLFLDAQRKSMSLPLTESAASQINVEDQAIARLQLKKALVDPVLTMRAIGMTYGEIRRHSGLSRKTIYSRISRSRRRARALAA